MVNAGLIAPASGPNVQNCNLFTSVEVIALSWGSFPCLSTKEQLDLCRVLRRKWKSLEATNGRCTTGILAQLAGIMCFAAEPGHFAAELSSRH